LQRNKTLVIATNKKSPNATYIYKVLWNGKLYTENYITYSMITNGGKMEIFLQDQPSSWGSAVNYRPSSLSK
jgi:putative alpha-1,2-mannosidase